MNKVCYLGCLVALLLAATIHPHAQNALGFAPVNKAGDTMTGTLVVPNITVSGTLGVGTLSATTVESANWGVGSLQVTNGFTNMNLTASRVMKTSATKTNDTVTHTGIVLGDGTQAARSDYSKAGLVSTFASPQTGNPYSLAAADCYGSVVFYGATGEIDLPAGVAGMNLIVYNTGSFTITIDPNLSEVIVRDGTAQTGGVSMTLSSGAGNYVAMVFDGARWITLGYKGTLAQGS